MKLHYFLIIILLITGLVEAKGFRQYGELKHLLTVKDGTISDFKGDRTFYKNTAGEFTHNEGNTKYTIVPDGTTYHLITQDNREDTSRVYSRYD